MQMHCEKVLIFPAHAAAITFPALFAAIRRRDVIASSRKTTIRVIHTNTFVRYVYLAVAPISAVITINLSASGSINFPKFVTRLCFLAIFPSRKSVNAVTAKITAAIIPTELLKQSIRT